MYYKLTTNEEGYVIQVESSNSLDEGFIELTPEQLKKLEKPMVKLDEVVTTTD